MTSCVLETSFDGCFTCNLLHNIWDLDGVFSKTNISAKLSWTQLKLLFINHSSFECNASISCCFQFENNLLLKFFLQIQLRDLTPKTFLRHRWRFSISIFLFMPVWIWNSAYFIFLLFFSKYEIITFGFSMCF